MIRIAASIAAGLVILTAAAPASAAPTTPLSGNAPVLAPGAEPVHWRRYRHCHNRGRRIVCHGGYVRPWRYRYGYAPYPYGYRYGGPGFTLRFGTGSRYRNDRRRR